MSENQPESSAPPPVVVVEDDRPAIVDIPPKSKQASLPKWEADARERVRAGVRRFAKPLNDLVARDANEGDTRMVVNRILTDVLGYDEFNDLTTEYQVKGEFADYGIRIDRDLVAFVEVKRIGTKLGAKHLRQVEMYAVNEGVEWVILTNGAEWRAYHLTGGLPVEIDLALDVNLLGEETPGQRAAQLFYLSRESLKRRQIDELWKARRATSPHSLAAVLLSPAVTEAVRKELRRTTGQRVDAADVMRLLRETVLRPECLG
ncbi:MAG: type I restriction enzyme HsdR N-terminal domain-containing protein [Gaiellaceae bacterium]